MPKNDDLILRGKALEDLRDIKEMLVAAGDPFLANIMLRAISCIENQPAALETDRAGKAKILMIKNIYIEDKNGPTINVDMTMKVETPEPIEWWQGLTEHTAVRTVARKLAEYLHKWLYGE